MMKKILMIATVPSMIGQFNMGNIDLLIKLGCQVEVACNLKDSTVWGSAEREKFYDELKKRNVRYHHIDFPRNPLSIHKVVGAYIQLQNLVKINNYNIIHCHTPVAGVLGRVMGYQKDISVIYTAHGFHFYKGAPIANWLIYYPIEWICSWMTDVLITINNEDYIFAKKYMHAKTVKYIPGVGINVKKFEECIDRKIRNAKRRELGIKDEEKVVLSVGELNRNKNHEVVIKALAKIDNINWGYYICGRGELQQYLEEMIRKMDLTGRVHFLGYRIDMREIYQAADLFVFPSYREGLSVALMEAMANALPIVASNIRGNNDLINDGENGYLVNNQEVKQYAEKISKLLSDDEFRKSKGLVSKDRIKDFDISIIENQMLKIYASRLK